MVITSIAAVIVVTAVIVSILLYRRGHRHYDRMSFRETLDLTGLPIVTFRQGDRKFNFILDTGAQNSLIDRNVLKEMKYTKLDGTTTGYGIDGITHTLDLVEVSLTYKGKTYDDTFRVLDMAASLGSLKRDYGVTVHGLLSSSFLERYRYVLSYNDLVAYSVV